MFRQFAVGMMLLGPGGAAQSATRLSQPGQSATLESPGALSFWFAAGAGAGRAMFDIVGIRSLDGDNVWRDRFILSLNGVDLLSGTYDLGGGGGNVTFFSPTGSLIDVRSFGLGNGGLGPFSLPLWLSAGANMLRLRYEGGAQGPGDEGWGISNLRVTALASAVAEPGTSAMMIVGSGLVGLSLRRRPAQEAC